MFIIAGLGNPTLRYEGTRHNVGFDVIDLLADKYNIAVDTRKGRALIGKGIIEGHKAILAKPQTYMNLSGESIRSLADYYKIDEEEELIHAASLCVYNQYVHEKILISALSPIINGAVSANTFL